jgi:hypothetical protein
MADRPNNFGEVLFKALGNTAKEAPSIFDNAATRKKAEALHLFDAILKLQDAEREKQQLTMAQQQQETQMKTAAMNQQLLTTQLLKLQQEIADPFPQWEKDKIKALQMAQAEADLWKWQQQVKMAKDMGVNLSGNEPSGSGAPGSFYLTPDDLVRRTQAKQASLQSAYSGAIEGAMPGPDTEAAIATYQPKIDELSSPAWFQANLANPVDSLGIPQALINPLAVTAQQGSGHTAMTREQLEADRKAGKVTDANYAKWDAYFKKRNQ